MGPGGMPKRGASGPGVWKARHRAGAALWSPSGQGAAGGEGRAMGARDRRLVCVARVRGADAVPGLGWCAALWSD